MNRELFHDIGQLLISLVILAGCFLFLWGVFFSGHVIPPDYKESLTQVTGGVIALLSAVSAFWIGTSLSSLRKDAKLAGSTEVVNNAAPASLDPALVALLERLSSQLPKPRAEEPTQETTSA